MTAVVYIHGRGGSTAESEHYRPLFPDCEVFGLPYGGDTPWDVGAAIHDAIANVKARFETVIVIANSIGAFFSMHAGLKGLVDKAYFISPVVDLERPIGRMMQEASVTEAALKERGVIVTPSGQELSWEYLDYVRPHPIDGRVPTHIRYGGRDTLTPRETIEAFAKAHGATLTVMEDGEHWFHTEEQMQVLDSWVQQHL